MKGFKWLSGEEVQDFRTQTYVGALIDALSLSW
jgi:hypothetical protein